MVDFGEPDRVVLQLQQALQALRLVDGDQLGVPVGYVFYGQEARIGEHGHFGPTEGPLVPGEVVDLLDELARALADSGPSEFGSGSAVTWSWLLARKKMDCAASGIRDDRPAVARREAREALNVLSSLFAAASRSARRRERPKRTRFVSGLVSAVWGDPQKIAADLVPKERLLFARRAKEGRVAIATDKQLVVAQRGYRGIPSRSIWCKAYPQIVSIEKDVHEHGTDLTLGTESEQLRLTLPDKDSADVLVMIWNRRRGITDRTSLDSSQ